MLHGVIADDLTGAMDAGVGFLPAGVAPVVVLSSAVSLDELPGTAVLIFDTESRNTEEIEAGRRVREGVKALRRLGGTLVFKKIDSTLRGNLGAEIRAVCGASKCGTALLAPALPRMGRTTENGIHLVNGTPLADTEYARDDLSPINSSLIADLVSRQVVLETVNVDLAALRSRDFPLQLSALVRRGVGCVICDAVTDQDLRLVATAWAGLGSDEHDRCLPVGSAGLFAQFRDLLELSAYPDQKRPAVAGPLLVVSASPSQVSKGQIAWAEKNLRGAVVFRAAPGAPKDGLADRVRKNLRAGRTVIVDGAGESRERSDRIRGGFQEQRAESRRIVTELAAMVAETVDHAAALVLFGGDTALSTCQALEVEALQIVDEMEPYVPLGRVCGGPRSGLLVVTKAGGFGTDRIIAESSAAIRDGRTTA